MSLDNNESKLILDNDTGHTNLRWTPRDPSTQLVSLDLADITTSVSAQNIVQSLPPQILYHAIKLASQEEVAAVLPLLSSDQMVRILDYDSWTELDLAPKKALALLSLLRSQEPTAMAARYKQLDEEYQIALIQKYVEMYDLEEFEKLPEVKKELVTAFPGGELFCVINTQDGELYGYIKGLIESAIALDINYAHSLIAHAFYLPPNETEFTLSQFRKARLEEDGFVSYDESLEAFVINPKLVESLKSKWSLTIKGESISQETLPVASDFKSNDNYLDDCLSYGISHDLWSELDALALQQGFLFLANCLCTAVKVESDDIKGLSRVLEQAKALASVGLEYLSGSSPTLAIDILKTEHPKNLFRTGLYLIDLLRNFVIHKFQTFNFKHAELLKKYKEQQKWGSIINLLDTNFLPVLGLQTTEVLKGLFNRFPMKPTVNDIDDVSITHITFEPITSLGKFNSFKITLDNILNDLHTLN